MTISSKIESIGLLSKLEDLIFQDEKAFYPTKKLRDSIQKDLILEAFKFHFLNNSEYKQFCLNKNITIEDIKNDVYKIPLLPSSLFKSHKIRTSSSEITVKDSISSGTSGSISIVERDTTTLERFLGSVRNAIDNVFKIEDAIVLNLGPSSEDAKDIWFCEEPASPVSPFGPGTVTRVTCGWLPWDTEPTTLLVVFTVAVIAIVV